MNGWEKGGSELFSPTQPSDVKGIFNSKSVKVTGPYGPTRNFQVEKSVDYVLSAYVKVVSGTLRLYAEYRDRSGADAWPLPLANLGAPYANDNMSVTTAQAPQWKYVELKVNAKQKATSAIPWVRAWIGKNTGDPALEAYVQDIRFYPADAHIATTYYHDTLQAPIMSVDDNGKPSRRVLYDGFGRKVSTRKLTFDANGLYTGTVKTDSTQYHLMRENDIYLLTPNGGEALSHGYAYPIQWAAQPWVTSVDVLYYNGSSWTTLAGGITTSHPSWANYSWTPAAAASGCKIKIQKTGASVMDESDGVFSIN